jgi:drug/metabolite transporter (DMT)-like permease
LATDVECYDDAFFPNAYVRRKALMSEERKVRPIRDVLRSRRFQREVSLLLFFFAGVNALFSALLFAASGADEAALQAAIVYALQAIIYAVLGIFIRRGSVKVLVFTGLLFAVDTVLTLLGPSWADARAVIIGRGLLIFVLYQFVRRERMRRPA